LPAPTTCRLSPLSKQRPENRTFVRSWSDDMHRGTLTSADARYLIAEDDHGGVAGFAILRGLTSEDLSIELKQIVARDPGTEWAE
jgi:hypothetical protein